MDKLQPDWEKAVSDGPIIFYDGDCGFCDASIRWVMPRDPEGIFRFAALQGETATGLFGPLTGTPESWTIVLLDKEGRHERSTAALRTLQRLRWGWILPTLGLWIPRFFRDGVYRLIARFRYGIFGKVTSCALPPPALRRRFLP